MSCKSMETRRIVNWLAQSYMYKLFTDSNQSLAFCLHNTYNFNHCKDHKNVSTCQRSSLKCSMSSIIIMTLHKLDKSHHRACCVCAMHPRTNLLLMTLVYSSCLSKHAKAHNPLYTATEYGDISWRTETKKNTMWNMQINKYQVSRTHRLDSKLKSLNRLGALNTTFDGNFYVDRPDILRITLHVCHNPLMCAYKHIHLLYDSQYSELTNSLTRINNE